jgi:hypothetical protein
MIAYVTFNTQHDAVLAKEQLKKLKSGLYIKTIRQEAENKLYVAFGNDLSDAEKDIFERTCTVTGGIVSYLAVTEQPHNVLDQLHYR